MGIVVANAMSKSPQSSRLRELLLDFFSGTGVHQPFRWSGLDPVVKGKAFDIARSWNLGLSDHDLDKYLTGGVVLALTAYGHTSFDTRLLISLHAMCSQLVDDDIMTNEMLRDFAPRFFDGREQLHPILTRFLETCSLLRSHYSTYSDNIIMTSTIDFVGAEIFLRDQGGPELHVEEASEYLDWIRWKTGIGEAYAAFVWPRDLFPETRTYIQAMPYASQFICLSNDLMSYYKEENAGETSNYLSQRMVTNGRPVTEMLEELVNRLVTADSCIKAVLGDSPERRAWEAFASGYAEYHLHTPRYMLKDLLPEYY